MSDYHLIANQWDCLTEPERTLANAMTDNLALGTAFVGKEVADAYFALYRGMGWEVYRDQWLANWDIVEFTPDPPLPPIPVYTTAEAWPFGIIECRAAGNCDVVTLRCRAVRGFP